MTNTSTSSHSHSPNSASTHSTFTHSTSSDRLAPPIGGFQEIDGRRVFVHRSGSGGPAVVFLPGASAIGLDYFLIQQKVSQFTTAVVYDRGGTGYSDPLPHPLPRTATAVATELHELLHAQNIPGPYVLVPHSLGGAYAHRFAQLYPQEVAGLVWLDAFHRDWDDFLPPEASLAASERMAPSLEQLRQARPAIREMGAALLADYPEHMRHALIDYHVSDRWIDVGFAERGNLAVLADELRPGPDLPDVPVIALTAEGIDPGQQALMPEQTLREMHEGKRRLDASLVNAVSRGEQRIISDVGHSQLCFERPGIVVQAIRDVVDWAAPTSQTVPLPHGLPVERDAGPFAPPRDLTRLREARPVSPMVFPDGHEGWIVTGYEAVRRLMADTRFSSRQDIGIIHVPYETPGMPAATEPSPQTPGLFIAMDPPDHTRLRRRLTGAFTVKRMRQLEERIIEIVEQQLDELARLTPPVDLVKEFALPVPSLVICELLGVPYADRATFQVNSAKFLEKDVALDEKMAAYGGMTTYLAELVTRKRTEPGDDILSDLARHDDLTIEELTGAAFLLLLAGHETTANMLALGTFALLEHPEQLAELRAHPDLLPDAVEELMRYLSVVDVLYRYATEDIELGGETIGKGSTVVVSLLAANHDPQRFDNPDTLDIHRKARGHLSFGHGIHQCLGQQLARIEMRAGFDGLLRRFPALQLAIPADEVKLWTDMHIYGVHELPVTWTETAR